MVLEGIRQRIHDLVHDYHGESRKLAQRRERVEGERTAHVAENRRYQQTQQEYEKRLRAYEAELGRYIRFDRPANGPSPPTDD